LNDIWALPTGEWVVYTDDRELIRDFQSLADLELVASYHGMFHRHRAVQFRFPQLEDVLQYVCYKAGFSLSRTLKLNKQPGASYKQLFGDVMHQPPLFIEAEPRRKKTR